MDRRTFMKLTAAGAVASGGLGPASSLAARRIDPSDQINVGVIGPGSRGQEVMRYMLRVPGVKVRGLADVYEERFKASRQITGEETPAFTDYRRLLDL